MLVIKALWPVPQPLPSVESGVEHHPRALRVGGQVDQVGESSAISAPSRSSRSASMAGIQSTQATIAARMGSVMATPTEKYDRTPCSRRLRMWRRKAWLAPGESHRMRMSLAWRY
jgi:hypothetical protein